MSRNLAKTMIVLGGVFSYCQPARAEDMPPSPFPRWSDNNIVVHVDSRPSTSSDGAWAMFKPKAATDVAAFVGASRYPVQGFSKDVTLVMTTDARAAQDIDPRPCLVLAGGPAFGLHVVSQVSGAEDGSLPGKVGYLALQGINPGVGTRADIEKARCWTVSLNSLGISP